MTYQHERDSVYRHKPQVWGTAKCAKLAKRNPKDYFGTPQGVGYVGDQFGHYAHGSGIIRYNGGTVIEGKWYAAEEFPLPILAAGYDLHRINGSSNHWILRRIAE